jgi:hypothetical protein
MEEICGKNDKRSSPTTGSPVLCKLKPWFGQNKIKMERHTASSLPRETGLN